MRSVSTRAQRPQAILAALGTTALAVALTACSSSSSKSVPGAASSSAPSAADSSAPSASNSVSPSAAVAAAASILPGSTMAKIKKRGTLIVAEALDAPLLSQQDPSNPKNVEGFDADLAKSLVTYILGKPSVKIVPPATETREALLGNGTVDVVFNTYTITTQRAAQVDFAGPYFSSGLAVAVKTGNTKVKSLADLGGKTVIVGANTPAVTEVPKRQPKAKIVQFATDPEAVTALKQGRGDAYIQDITLLASDAKTDPGITVVGNPFTSEPYGIGLKHGDAKMKSFVNTWLLQIEKDGTWAAIWKNTLGTVVQSAPPTPPKIGSVPGS